MAEQNTLAAPSMINGVQPKTIVYCFNHSAQAEEAGDAQQVGQEWAERWYHIQTPMKKACRVMYRYDIEGYSYGVGAPIDLTFVGYPYTESQLCKPWVVNRNKDLMPNLNLEQYWRGDTLYLKFGPIARYCNAFSIYYSAHFHNPSLGLNKSEYKVTVTATENNLS